MLGKSIRLGGNEGVSLEGALVVLEQLAEVVTVPVKDGPDVVATDRRGLKKALAGSRSSRWNHSVQDDEKRRLRDILELSNSSELSSPQKQQADPEERADNRTAALHKGVHDETRSQQTG